jgi:peptidoglycan/xylan/chitin deacetylase (PgdA/CDA1 family)
MKSSMRSLGCAVIAGLGLPRLLNRFAFPHKVTIVVYHGIIQSPLDVYNSCFLDEESFRTQVAYLRTNFQVLRLCDAVEKLRSKSVDRPTAVITFDDGYQNNYDVAFPILREAGVPATIFLTTALLNSDDTFWNLRLNRALSKTEKTSLEWDGRVFDLVGPTSKRAAGLAIASILRELPRGELTSDLHTILRDLEDDPDCAIEVDSPFRMLNYQAIADMTSSGLIDFGAHGHTHAKLTRLSPEEQREEIERSLAMVSDLTGAPCKLFAYPFGKSADYDDETIRILETCGVRVALTGIRGGNDVSTHRMELRRYGIDADLNMALFQIKVHHFQSLLTDIMN